MFRNIMFHVNHKSSFEGLQPIFQKGEKHPPSQPVLDFFLVFFILYDLFLKATAIS